MGRAQLSLSFPERLQRGGRRLRAGRKRGRDGGPRHAKRPHLARPLPAHVTLRVRRDVPSLRSAGVVHEIERSFAEGCARPGFRLVHYSLQGNHAHLVIEARDKDALGRGMMALASRVARAVNRGAERSGPVLAGRYHLRLLPTPREVRNALRYVLLNGRRHAAEQREAVAGPVLLDRASSARWFDGWKRSVPSAPANAPPASSVRAPVARARTWLLAVGWRRHGLIDPADVPGK